MGLSRSEVASSTTLDTVALVVLVGVAVVVLGAAEPARPATGRVAEETGDVLATSTTAVTFSRTATAPGSDGESAVSVERRAHGTYAELLAAAAVVDPVWIDDGLTGGGDELTARVRETTSRVLQTRAANVEVRAVWRPYPGASLERAVVTGEAPPRDASVAVATVTVPSEFPNVTARALAAADGRGFGGVATVIARGVVVGLFPPELTADALYSEGADRVVVERRYHHAGNALGTDVDDAVRDGDVAAANEQLVEELAVGIRGELQQRYDSPTAAARALRLERVRIVVRTWSP